MKKVVTFGELMLRLAPPGYDRFVQTDSFNATYGGAEANVAVSLCNFGIDASYVTKLPTHEIGQAAVNSLRRYGVSTSNIARGGERVGIYYLEKGASQRPSKVIYDRAHASIATAKPQDFDWEKILKGVDWFHFTGITPALGGNLPEICKQACITAQKLNITVSCDINYRNNLWSKQDANKVMSDLMQYVDICISNEEDSADVFDIHSRGTDVTAGELKKEGYIDVAKQLTDRFGFKAVAVTLRESISASNNNWGAMLYKDGQPYFSTTHSIQIVDRVGGGDSFGAGLIYSTLSDFSPQDSVEFAVAASCLKHTIEGDYNMVNVNEVLHLAKGDASGRVQR